MIYGLVIVITILVLFRLLVWGHGPRSLHEPIGASKIKQMMGWLPTPLTGATASNCSKGSVNLSITGVGIMSEGFSGLGKSRKSIRASASSKHGRINGTEHKNIKKAFIFMQQGNHKDAEVIYKKLIKEKPGIMLSFKI